MTCDNPIDLLCCPFDVDFRHFLHLHEMCFLSSSLLPLSVARSSTATSDGAVKMAVAEAVHSLKIVPDEMKNTANRIQFMDINLVTLLTIRIRLTSQLARSPTGWEYFLRLMFS
jgi:hypothetical protein